MAFDFKKMVADDRRLVFLNLAEFGEEHKVDGKTITVVLDDNALKERQGGQELGVAESSLMLYAAVEDLPPRRPASISSTTGARTWASPPSRSARP